MVNIAIWVAVGATIGLLGSIALRNESERGTTINMVISIAGALAAELILVPLLGITPAGRSDFGLPALMGAVSVLGAFSAVREVAQRYRPGL